LSDCHSTPVSVTNILINKIIINKNETFTHPATPSENRKKEKEYLKREEDGWQAT
jgi:hypothetical protein